MVGSVAGAASASSMTLTRNAERSAEQAQRRANELQRESQRLESEADRTQRNADRLYNQAEETDSAARSLIAQSNAQPGSIEARQAFPTVNPLERSSDSNAVPRETENTSNATELMALQPSVPSVAGYNASEAPAPGSFVSERV